jgi:hypothetical protein
MKNLFVHDFDKTLPAIYEVFYAFQIETEWHKNAKNGLVVKTINSRMG